MAEQEKNKAGLQKEVSSVFKGVPVPQNNNAKQSSGTPAPNHTPGAFQEPAPEDKQISKSSLINKLNQPEDSSDNEEQNQTANVIPKPTSTKQMPQNPLVNKPPQPKEPLKQAALQPEDDPFLEETSSSLWQQIKDKLFTPKPGVSPIKQKAMVIMVPVLAIIMVFVFRQVLSKAPRKTEGAGTDDAPVVVANADSGNEIDWKIPEPIQAITRDPIKISDESITQGEDPNETTGDDATETIIVRDIVYSKDKPSAVIGSKIVYVGDIINGFTIVKINRDSIEFEKDGERWEQNVRDGKMIPIVEVSDESQGQSESIE